MCGKKQTQVSVEYINLNLRDKHNYNSKEKDFDKNSIVNNINENINRTYEVNDLFSQNILTNTNQNCKSPILSQR